MEIKFENYSGFFALKASLNYIRGISKIISDASSLSKTGLMLMDERVDERLQSRGKEFRAQLDHTILLGDRTKVVRRHVANFLLQ